VANLETCLLFLNLLVVHFSPIIVTLIFMTMIIGLDYLHNNLDRLSSWKYFIHRTFIGLMLSDRITFTGIRPGSISSSFFIFLCSLRPVLFIGSHICFGMGSPYMCRYRHFEVIEFDSFILFVQICEGHLRLIGLFGLRDLRRSGSSFGRHI